MNVAVVSLSPVCGQGGSERFTLDAIQSIRGGGDRCEAFAVRESDEAGSPLANPSFLHTFDSRGDRELAFSEVLGLLRSFDVVWVHQYLASDLIFDILNTIPDELPLLLTTLGNESVWPRFARRYRPGRNHRFVDAEESLAGRAHLLKGSRTVVHAGIWSDFIGCTNPVPRERGQICTLDGISSRSGLETVILGLPPESSLVVVGPPERDATFLKAVGAAVVGRKVYFTGDVPETRRRAVLAASEIAVAAHVSPCPFAALPLLEALGCDTLPLTSDIPSHVEAMESLGLSEFVFPAGRHDLLSALIGRVMTMSVEELAGRKSRARAYMRQSWLWDDYWLRMRRELRLALPEAETRDPARAGRTSSVRTAAVGGHSMSSHGLNWKVFSF